MASATDAEDKKAYQASGWHLAALIGGNAASVVPYIFMLGVLIVRPTGMFGWRRIERV